MVLAIIQVERYIGLASSGLMLIYWFSCLLSSILLSYKFLMDFFYQVILKKVFYKISHFIKI